MQVKNIIHEYFDNLKNTIDSINKNDIEQVFSLMVEAYKADRQIFIMGNGGSATTASHFACDINKGVTYGLDKRFKVISLVDSIATMTAYANDLCYEDIFLEQLKNLLRPEDLVIGISGSGNSKNVIKAIEYANLKQCSSIGITGFDGGILMKTAAYNINVPIHDMQIAEDAHMILTHVTMKLLIHALASPEADTKKGHQ